MKVLELASHPRSAPAASPADAIAGIVAICGRGRDALLPLLHAIQEAQGYIDDSAVPHIAEALNLSRADVHGVITFYHDFRRAAPGRRIIKICRAESCRARGALAVERALVARAGVAIGTSSADGALTIDRIHCFGLCATGPNLMVDGDVHSRVDARTIDRILEGAPA